MQTGIPRIALITLLTLSIFSCKEAPVEPTRPIPVEDSSVPATPELSPSARNPEWAAPMELAGCLNFFKVSDELYRGAQPSAQCVEELKKLGVKTIVNLRSFHSDRDEVGETGIAYEHIYMKAWRGEDKEVVRFLQIVSDPAKTPVFLHCKHGADRTGIMSAIYRVAIQGWSKEDALEEITEGGFGWHFVWNKTLLPYFEELDVDAMKKRAGI